MPSPPSNPRGSEAPASDLALERLKRLHPKSIDLSLGRILRLLAALGHPERRLPPVVHIAGTNGKGSTLAMLDAALAAADVRVDRYISPHLVRFAERILIRGRPIDEARLSAVLDRCERVNAGETITFFEVTTAAAFQAFTDDPADLVLLETGLGGEFDATNVVDRPRLCLLSPVSMDHEGYLGDTLEAITAVKAGILKPGVTTLVGRQEPPALRVIEHHATSVGAPLRIMGRDFDAGDRDGRLIVEVGRRRLDLPLPALAGVHQVENAGLAVAAALELRPDLDAATLSVGLRRTHWPARLQTLTRGPLVAALPPGSVLWLDGGHNPAAGEALARSLAGVDDPRPLHLVVGMLATKDARAFLRPLVGLASSVAAVAIADEPGSLSAEAVAAAASELGAEAAPFTDIAAALDAAAAGRRPIRVLVCGSLYLAGQILRANG